MTNSVINVPANTATLVFSGTGKVYVEYSGYIGGDNTVSSSSGMFASSGVRLEFSSPSEIWAVNPSSGNAKVVHWY